VASVAQQWRLSRAWTRPCVGSLDMSPSLAARHGWYTRTRAYNGQRDAATRRLCARANDNGRPCLTERGRPITITSPPRTAIRSSRRPWRTADFYHVHRPLLSATPVSIKFGIVNFLLFYCFRQRFCAHGSQCSLHF
jgi:hypothetical protein